MTWEWLVLTALVKAIFVLVPLLDISGDFNLGSTLEEAKEFAAASSTREMLFASPILVALRTLYETSHVCTTGADPFRIAVSAAMLGVLLLGCYAVPPRLFRGSWTPVVWFLILTAAEILSEIFFVPRAGKAICA